MKNPQPSISFFIFDSILLQIHVIGCLGEHRKESLIVLSHNEYVIENQTNNLT